MFPTIGELTAAYRAGARTPEQVVDRALASVARSESEPPALRAVIHLIEVGARNEARASTQRWREGAPRSPLDGVPVLVKDNLHVAGQPTTNGTTIRWPIPQRDSRVVERLRAAGAIVIGKANQHEIGAGTTGINPHFGTPRNPYDDGRWCGGSSSGSACAVGAGIVPMAIGTDAGGSVRAPAAFVGAVGLKPTFGRVSRLGMSILCDTIDTIGPIAISVRDAALSLVAIGGAQLDDDETWDQPPLPGYAELDALLDRPVKGLRVGIDRTVLRGPLVDAGVAAQVAGAADALAAAGAILVDVALPDPEQSVLLGLVILGAEGPSGLEDVLQAHHDQLGADLQVLLSVGENFSARDYLKAQRMRNIIRGQWAELFGRVDVVLNAATGVTAQRLRPEVLETGELDDELSTRIIAQTFPSNLTGYPAISVPVGWSDGLPVSAQVIAPPWQEIACLHVAAALERGGLFERRRPLRYYGLD